MTGWRPTRWRVVTVASDSLHQGASCTVPYKEKIKTVEDTQKGIYCKSEKWANNTLVHCTKYDIRPWIIITCWSFANAWCPIEQTGPTGQNYEKK